MQDFGRALGLALVLALAACGQSTAPPAAESTAQAAPASLSNALFSYGGGVAPILVENPTPGEYNPPPIWFICDSIDGDDIFVASILNEGGGFGLAHYNRSLKQAQRSYVQLSGEMFAAPNGPAQAFADADGTQGVIYTLDPARMSSPDAATTPAVIGLDFASEEFQCRYFEHTLFMGFTATESVVVRRVGDNIQLMIFGPEASSNGLMVEMQHGEQSSLVDVTAENGVQGAGHNRENVVQWVWESADDGKQYNVWTVPDEASVIQPSTGGEITQTDEFLAYVLAR